MPDYTTCAVCNRVVESGHVNTSGRCVDCAGRPAEAAAQDETPKRPAKKDGDKD